MMGVDLIAASHMASATPAAFMGLGGERGMIAPGQSADLVHLDAAHNVQATWIDGVRA